MNLLKAFNIVNQDLLLAKIKVYSFLKDLLALMCSYPKKS